MNLITVVLISLLCTFCISSCPIIQNKSNISIIGIKETKKYKYNIDNSDSKYFGYKEFIDDESIGVSNIYIYANSLFLSDALHNSVKEIDMNTGKIMENFIIADSSKFLGLLDMTIKGNSLIITTRIDSVYIVDLANKTIKSIYANSDTKKVIFSEDDTSVFITLKEEQQKDLSVKFDLIQIDGAGKGNLGNRTMPIKQYDTHINKLNLRGKEVALIRDSLSNNLLKIDNKIYQLPEGIEPIKTYSANNFDFSNHTYAYFNYENNKFVITISKY